MKNGNEAKKRGLEISQDKIKVMTTDGTTSKTYTDNTKNISPK